MKRKLFSTILLSLTLASTNCLYAEETIQPQVHSESENENNEMIISDEVITEEISKVHSETQLEDAENAETNISDLEAADTNLETSDQIGETGQVTEEEKEEEQENTPSTGEIAGELQNKVILTLNSKTALVDGEEVELLTAPKIVNDTTLLPLRFVGEQVVGAQVDWDSQNKTVTIKKDGIEVIVVIGSKIAKVDGLECKLLTEPVIENSTTLVPVRFISEAFNIKVDYDNQSKKITIDRGNLEEVVTPTPNTAPIASFYFPETYVAGQAVTAIDTSVDPDGDQITEKLWSVLSDGKVITNKELSNMFKTPRAGTYVIGLQVKDSKGLWSEWTYETVTIEENKAPVITSLTSNKTSYAQGEKMDFSYSYDNESWEKVTEGKWTYRKASEASNKATLGKPDVLFTEGEYIITLYLDDAYGNRSEGVETHITVTSEVLSSELNYRFTQGSIGDWIDNFQGDNYLNYTPVTLQNMTYDYGTLIMSDSPENVTGQGILYRDKINGVGRLLIHHINSITDTTETQRLVFVVENPTDKPITVALKNKAIKGPATDVLRVGQLCLNEYLSGQIPTETIELQPGERKYIYDKNWATNTCISAHIDVETTGEALFTVANIGKNHTLNDLDTLYYFPADGAHYSGTYGITGINYELNLSGKEAERLTIGVKGANEWIVGYDERTELPVENTGNFGVSYKIKVTAEEDMGVILNNRGGTFQGAIKWNDTVYNMPGKGVFSGTTTKAVVMGVIKKGETVTIEYLLPNGSAAPTLIGFIPKSQW